MTQTLTKKQLIEKIVKEQGVDPKSLDRLNVEALKKMDAAIKDEDDLLGSNSESSTSPQSGSVEGNGDELGQSVSSENGTGIVNKPVSPSSEPSVPAQDSTELSTEPDFDGGAGSGSVDENMVIGEHPATGEPVRVCDQ